MGKEERYEEFGQIEVWQDYDTEAQRWNAPLININGPDFHNLDLTKAATLADDLQKALGVALTWQKYAGLKRRD